MWCVVLILLLTLLPQQPADVPAQFNQAVALQQAGKFVEAEAAYRALLQQKSDYAEAQANFGVVLARLGKNDEAITAYEKALALAPQLTPILLNAGILHYRAGHFEKAIEVLDKFLQTHADHLQARQLLGLSLVEIGYNSAAIEQLLPTLSAAPNDAAVLYSLGLAYLRTNKKTQTQEIIERLAASPTNKPAAHLLKGQALIASFEFESAVAALKKAQELNAELPRLNYSLGLSYYKLGRNAEALAAFTAEHTRKPQDFTTIYYLGLLHEAEGNLDDAKRFADLALTMQPASVEVLTVLGKILTRQGKNAEAAVMLEKALAQDPRDSLKHYLLGKIYRELGRRDDSNREFDEARKLKAAEAKADQEKPAKP